MSTTKNSVSFKEKLVETETAVKKNKEEDELTKFLKEMEDRYLTQFGDDQLRGRFLRPRPKEVREEQVREEAAGVDSGLRCFTGIGPRQRGHLPRDLKSGGFCEKVPEIFIKPPFS